MARNFYLTADAAAASTAASLRDDAYDSATKEARRYLAEGVRGYLDIRARLDELIAERRGELANRRVAAGEIETWDTSFRVMFLLRTWRPL